MKILIILNYYNLFGKKKKMKLGNILLKKRKWIFLLKKNQKLSFIFFFNSNCKKKKRINIFSPYIDEKKNFLQVCDTIWINYSEKDVKIFFKNLIYKKKSFH